MMFLVFSSFCLLKLCFIVWHDIWQAQCSLLPTTYLILNFYFIILHTNSIKKTRFEIANKVRSLFSQNLHVSLTMQLPWDFVLICVVKFPTCENVFSQMLHWWTYLPPWTILMWFFRTPDRENDKVHNSQIISLVVSWTACMCDFKCCVYENVFSHFSRLFSLLCPSWTLLIWFFRLLDWVKASLQKSHLKFLWPSWIVFMCILNWDCRRGWDRLCTSKIFIIPKV